VVETVTRMIRKGPPLLQDAGNTTTLAHYLALLETAFLDGIPLEELLGSDPRRVLEAVG